MKDKIDTYSMDVSKGLSMSVLINQRRGIRNNQNV